MRGLNWLLQQLVAIDLCRASHCLSRLSGRTARHHFDPAMGGIEMVVQPIWLNQSLA